jgi:pretoxin HINT domain-containing protein
MTKQTRTHIAVLSLALGCVTSSVQAAKPEADEAEQAKVQQVLQSEATTEPTAVNRREALQPTLRPATKSDSTWWQSGYVKVDGEWRSVEKSTASSREDGLWAEYRRQRVAALKTADGQFALANWCRSHKLADQEQAHLTQFIQMSEPGRDHGKVYERLGYLRIGHSWLSPRELDELKHQNEERDKHLKLWQPRIEQIVRLMDGQVKQRKVAATRLGEINDSVAIPAIVQAAMASEAFGVAALDHLAKSQGYEASQALAFLAVSSQSPTLRATAIEKLQERRLDDFVPMLLSMMHGSIRVKDAIKNQQPEKLLIREDADRIVIVEHAISTGTDWVYIWSIRRPWINGLYPATRENMQQWPGSRLNGAQAKLEFARTSSDNSRLQQDYSYAFSSRVDQANDVSESFNQKAGETLAAVSGQQESSNPSFWWTWWSIQTGYQELPKQVVIVRETERKPDRIIGTIQRSCLVAGTLVWTDRGFMAVEKIAAGDRVLAKCIESGELAYKPVVHTTVRQPVPVKKFVVNGQPVVASDGHNFWVSGSGWTKTRELIPQQPIHTVVGMARVESVEDEAEPAPVYNLVVADFHTYFVGPAMILSHDVLPTRPTNVKVPGLAAK